MTAVLDDIGASVMVGVIDSYYHFIGEECLWHNGLQL